MNLPVRHVPSPDVACVIMPSRKAVIPDGFELMQPNRTLESIEEARRMNPFRVWLDLESGRYCYNILVKL